MKPKKFFSNTYVKGSLLVIAGLLAGWIIFHRPAPTVETSVSGLHEHSVAICGMDLIPLKTTHADIDDEAIEMSESALKLAEVQTIIVSRGSTSKEVMLYGKIQLNESLLQSQTAHVPGRIEQLTVNVTGETVNKGQLIARVYSPELITAQKELIEALSMKEKYPAFVEAAREKLRNWKLSDEQISVIEKSGIVNSVSEIFANTSGIVLDRKVSEGDYIAKGAVLYDVADLSRVWGVFDAYESDLPWISMNQTMEFTARAVPGDIFTGRVSFIDPFINPATRTARIRVEVNNRGRQLKPEMFINGTLHSAVKAGGKELIIPQSAVLWTGRRSIVYVKIPDSEQPSFKMREISLGASMKDTYIVVEGLSEGEEIVANGTFSVDAAAQLAGKPSMMSPEGGAAKTGHEHGGTAMTGAKADVNQTGSLTISTIQKPDNISSEFKSQLTRVYDAYLKMKDAFVASDAKKASGEAIKVRNAIEAVDMGLLKGDAHTMWMEHLKTLRQSINSIAGSSDIEGQRTAFSGFSNHLYSAIKTFGLLDKTVYYQFCPMAFDDKGAYWLSETDAIRNPYFGDAMLKCGETKETSTFGK